MARSNSESSTMTALERVRLSSQVSNACFRSNFPKCPRTMSRVWSTIARISPWPSLKCLWRSLAE
ncbi:hypothetical protein EMPG_15415 [Blastomyces silverae]|uniref:Uncharacterized protein n=1 Tax=Blastomyces silverae TaxID=2060906 RepID=A0A0H1BDN7_9EURO|nr:hypothetical protein EMPG_15415 [Blastomyces silverae]